MTNKIVAEIQRLINCPKLFKSEDIETRISVLEYLLTYIDSLQKEPTSEELEKAANEWNAKASFNPFYMALDDKGNPYEVRQDYTTHAESFKAGAKWQKQKQKDSMLVSEELEDACKQLAENARKHKAETLSPFFSQTDYIQGVMDGVKWAERKTQKK